MEIYKLGVVDIPTNVDIARIDHDDKIYRSFTEKVGAIAAVVGECQERKQPVLIGTVSIEKSEILSNELKKLKIPHKVLNARHHEQESQIIANAGEPGAVTIATNMAGRGTDIKLGGNLDMRVAHEVSADLTGAKRDAAIAKIDAEITANQAVVIEAGGLYVIGTERHESRRVDNQLRGRSGRQGDPGSTIFFLSTQDDLMRIFSPEALEGVLSNKAIGLKEGEALAHPWLTKALQRAQARVEQQNFEMRKTLLKFDNVMNDQRTVIYDQRREVMGSDDITEFVTDIRHEVIDNMVANTIPPKAYADQWDIETLTNETSRILHLDLPIAEWAKEEGIADEEIIDRIIDASDAKMAEKARNGGDIFQRIQKSMVLQTLDQSWKEHLFNLDHVRQGINLRAFGQKDPLNEYKTEAFMHFEGMLDMMKEAIVHDLSLVEFDFDEKTVRAMLEARRVEQEMQKGRSDPALAGQPIAPEQSAGKQQTPTPFRREFDQEDETTWDKVGRNAPCPCGSGKKYKQCHGKVAAA
jgi:preprotein translocase subunit SecA